MIEKLVPGVEKR